jgi:ABC-type transport system involved in multi-copper enzyme maturation permease subunit
MTAMISAELLRLRTVATHRWIALGMVALAAVNSAPFVNGASTSADQVISQLRGLAQLAILLLAAYAAHTVGDEFRRGSVAMTYLVHPSRGRVTAAHAVTYAAVGAVLAAFLAGAAMAIVLPVAGGDHINTGFGSADIVLVLAGSALGGAVLGAAGALIGAVARHPGLAMGIVVVWSVSESLVTRGGTRGGIGPYLPFQLVGAVTSLSDDVAVLPAIGLLVVYLTLLVLAVRRWALPRDLT